MKKTIASILLLGAYFFGFSQQTTENTDVEQKKQTWYHDDLPKAGLYGVNTQGAYEFLESKGLHGNPITVAVVDSGVQIDHAGLEKNIWTNPHEIPDNGIDDDKNGYIDDVHGWNFIGGKEGDVGSDNLEVTRIVRQYKPIFDSEQTEKNVENKEKMPQEFALYQQAKQDFDQKITEATQNYKRYSQLDENINRIVELLQGRNLTEENINAISPIDGMQALGKSILSQMLQDPNVAGKSSQETLDYLQKQIKEALEYFGNQTTKQYNLDFDPRGIVGDDYGDVSQKYYGNNHYQGPEALHGTHVAGIIAGSAQGKEIQYGVASRVAKIMSVRAVPDGDERDKDVANAIDYAVDNGAKVINMSFGKTYSPNKEIVWQAFEKAQKKGVLLVKAAGNDNQDIEKNIHYPTNYKNVEDEKPFVNNVIVIGASTRDDKALKANFSNYNKKMVDVFAPGDEIYSTVPEGEYRYLQGTSMASPVVAGAAAVLFSYMPTLTPEQVIESLVVTCNKPSSKELDNDARSQGVVDLYKAAKYAYENYYLSEEKKLQEQKYNSKIEKKKHVEHRRRTRKSALFLKTK